MSTFHLTMLSIFGVLVSLLTLSLQYKHLLSILLSLEAVTMSLFVLMFSMSSNISLMGETSLILITLGACEASLGLAILVAIIRAEGNDYVSSFSMHKC
uniref:NADH-ubiquinone oxidoreductase chain 4L n=10 Tax=Conus TaxID=6490 RepID=A0A4V1DXT7_9COND|nr:NADH dehydrogenase subunit 4L [Conus ateralbus]ATZ69818.1 NADH dehydrogenase subunit 4L [Conus ermineus]ATZ69830.1 NADH dehydrogenase subunit 4L [Conus trochulus]ATZ69987.1 NADH dehydrogenase subunit 4L [Conus venulatus]ATZ70273.1 NADH dehydrogenase subunit 4L [Conus pseudonivifer]ATZ70468.1 NADH dehydrogenase subunit 4L [Conus sp. MNCN 95052]ATZ70897.1 NADH dehydrogenase subunit 4L [Conus freitasi]ATZ70949.1 NADH dehydrogenase subunit 4L [Conus denizi]QCL17934.1 NADH dehydrogenase subun